MLAVSINHPESIGVLLVGHGTRDPEGTREFFEIGEKLAAVLGGDFVVVPCLLEFQEPTIAQAWTKLMETGCGQVVVAPLLLFAAGHAKSDIPGEVAAAQNQSSRGRTVPVTLCPPISRQGEMIDAVRERLIAALGPKDHSQRTAVVMVGRGSRDVCASADMRLLSEVAVIGKLAESGHSIASHWGIGRQDLFTTFYAMAEPRLPDTLAQVAMSNRFDRIVVHPHLLFSGRLYDAILSQVDEAASAHPGIDFCVSDYLGPVEKVARAVGARVRASVSTSVIGSSHSVRASS